MLAPLSNYWGILHPPPLSYVNGSLSFEKTIILDSYLIHSYKFIKSTSSSSLGKIAILFWEFGPLFNLKVLLEKWYPFIIFLKKYYIGFIKNVFIPS